MRAIQSHAMPPATFGWVSQLPPLQQGWKLWARIRAGQRCHRAANRFLRAILYGGNSHLEPVTGANLIRIVLQLFQKGQVTWPDRSKSGSPLWALNNWFKRNNYAVCGPFHWESDHDSMKVCFTEGALKAPLQHAARQGWRWNMWLKFVRSSRHEAQELAAYPVEAFAKLNFKKLRRDLEDPALRALAIGAFLSSACPGRDADRPSSCPWCDVALGHWHHVAWEWEARPQKLHRPPDLLAARFGWGASRAEVSWLSSVVQRIWVLRHN